MFKYIKIGNTLKSVHSSGEMVTSIQADFVEDAINSKAIFLEIDGLNVPFFVENIECNGNICYIKFEEFNTPEEVRKYNNVALSLRESDVNWKSKSKNSITNKSDFSGFEIIDTNTGKVLDIESTEQFPQQLMSKAISREDKKEYFIPLIEEFIEDIDYANKKITVSLPDGLI